MLINYKKLYTIQLAYEELGSHCLHPARPHTLNAGIVGPQRYRELL